MNKLLFVFAVCLVFCRGAFSVNPAPVSMEVSGRKIIFMDMKLEFIEFVLKFDSNTRLAAMQSGGHCTDEECLHPVGIDMIKMLSDIGMGWDAVTSDGIGFSCGQMDPYFLPLCYLYSDNKTTCDEHPPCKYRSDSRDRQSCRSDCRGPCVMHNTLPAAKDAIFWQFECDGGAECAPQIDPHRLTVFLFLKGRDLKTDEVMHFASPELTDQLTVANFLDGSCRLHLSPERYNVFDAQYTTKVDMYAHRQDVAALVPQNVIKLAPARSCDYQCTKKIGEEFKKRLAQGGGILDFEELHSYTENLEAVFGRDCWFNCLSLMADSVEYEDKSVTFTTDRCVFPREDAQFGTEPCCNRSLLLHDCCEESERTFDVNMMSGVHENNALRNCPSGSNKLAKLLAILENFASSESYVKDCSRQAAERMGGGEYWKVGDDVRKAVDSCIEEVYGYDGSGKECTQNADCLSEQCTKKNPNEDRGNCAVKETAGALMLTCLEDELMEDVFLYYKTHLGIIPTDTPAQAAAKFESKSQRMNCKGPHSWPFRAGWFYNFTGCEENNDTSSSSVPRRVEKQKKGPRVVSFKQAQREARAGIEKLRLKHGQPVRPPRRPHALSVMGVRQQNKPVTSLSRREVRTMGDEGGDGDDSMRFCEHQRWVDENGRAQCWEDNPEENHCYYDPSSQAACESVKFCNHQYTWDGDNQTESCLKDRLKENGNFCGICYSSEWCEDISQRSYCTFQNIQDENECIDNRINGTYEEMNGWWQVCSTSETPPASPAECWDNCYDEDGPKPGQEYQCVNTDVTQSGVDEDCNGNDHWWYRGYRDPKTHMWMNEKLCVRWADKNYCDGLPDPYVWTALGSNTDEDKMWRCQQTYCYNNTMSKDECQSKSVVGSWFWWDHRLNNNVGGCMAHDSTWSWSVTAQMKTDCEGLGFSLYIGRWYENGFADDQSKCTTQGVCNNHEMRWMSAADCISDGAFCNRGCMGCRESWSANKHGLCHHDNETACTEENFSWQTDATPAYCDATSKYSVESECQQAGYSWAQCRDYTEDSCKSSQFSDVLDCRVDWMSCPDEEACDLAGECDDWYLFDWNKANDMMGQDPNLRWEELQKSNCCGVCIVPKSFTDWGWYGCDWDTFRELGDSVHVNEAPIGCAISGIDEGQCAQMGGEIKHRSQDKAECLAGGQGCCETWSHDCRWQLTPKTPSECADCGGTMHNYNTWRGGSWIPGAMVQGEWKQREWTAVNTWTNMIDPQRVRQDVMHATATFIMDVLEQGIRCRSGLLLGIVLQYAGLCGANQDSSAVALLAGAVQSELFEGDIPCGTETILQVAGFQVELTENSCTSESSVEVIVTSQMVSGTDGGGASPSSHVLLQSMPGLMATAEQEAAACYAQVENTAGSIVGQLLGNCLVWNPPNALGTVSVCLNVDTSIPWDSTTYPTKGVCTATELANGDIQYVKKTATVEDRSDSVCLDVSAAATLCPIAYASTPPSNPPTCSSSEAEALQSALETLYAGAVALEFNTQPASDTKVGESLPAFEVYFIDGTGTKVAATAAVTLAVKTGTGTAGALVTGSTREEAVVGVATFDEVEMTKSGSGFVLVASSGTLALAESAPFSVAAGDPVRVRFAVQPAGCTNGNPCLQQPKVEIVDSEGNLCTTSTAAVTLTPATGWTGTLIKSAVGGVATFTGLTYTGLASDLQFGASSTDLMSANSNEFDVVATSGFAVKLAFTSSFPGVDADEEFTVTVAVQDYDGATVVTAAGAITLVIEDGTGVDGAALGGTVSAAPVDGVTTFTGVSISRAAAGYKLATSNTHGLAEALSTAFDVAGAADLSFSNAPTSVAVDTEFSMTVNVLDLSNSILTTASDGITLGIKPGTGSPSGLLSGTITKSASSGAASFTDLKISEVGTGYVIVAITANGLTAESATISVTATGGSSSSSLGAGAIAGIAIGSVVFVGGMVLGLLYLCKEKKEASTLTRSRSHMSDVGDAAIAEGATTEAPKPVVSLEMAGEQPDTAWEG